MGSKDSDTAGNFKAQKAYNGMCCRYRIKQLTDDDRLIRVLALMERDYPGEYKTGDIFPGDTAPAVIGERGALRHVPATFGFAGFKDKQLIINARSETVTQKPTFADSFLTRRVVLPADGFYEWSHDGTKTKYLFTRGAPQTLWLCGIYKYTDGKCRFVILTKPANESIKDIHDRMPVIIDAGNVRKYLTDDSSAMNMIMDADPLLSRSIAE